MHSPDQAGALLCPITKSRCTSHACAMWRWGEVNDTLEESVVPAPEFGAGGKRIEIKKIKTPSRGYCGIAGRPEIFR